MFLSISNDASFISHWRKYIHVFLWIVFSSLDSSFLESWDQFFGFSRGLTESESCIDRTNKNILNKYILINEAINTIFRSGHGIKLIYFNLVYLISTLNCSSLYFFVDKWLVSCNPTLKVGVSVSTWQLPFLFYVNMFFSVDNRKFSFRVFEYFFFLSYYLVQN